jgi:hypothetical protein
VVSGSLKRKKKKDDQSVLVQVELAVVRVQGRYGEVGVKLDYL